MTIEEAAEKIMDTLLGIGGGSWRQTETIIPILREFAEGVRAERDEWWNKRGHWEGPGGCFYHGRPIGDEERKMLLGLFSPTKEESRGSD